MSLTASLPATETGFDSLFRFTLPERNARGRLVRLGPVLDAVLAAHDYPPAIKALLAEALVLTALIGGLAKEQDSQMTMQARSDSGPVELLVCDYRQGELRGYVQHDASKISALGANPTLEALFGEGYLALTFDLATSKERYQGVVALEGASLARACEGYFARSEQIPTLIRLGVRLTPQGAMAGGLLIQHLPDGEEGHQRLHVQADHPEWETVSVLAASIRHEELTDPALSMEAMAWRLFSEECAIHTQPALPLVRGCRCTSEYYRTVLSRFPEEERAEMRDDGGTIPVDCAFCSRRFDIAA